MVHMQKRIYTLIIDVFFQTLRTSTRWILLGLKRVQWLSTWWEVQVEGSVKLKMEIKISRQNPGFETQNNTFVGKV